MTALIDRPLLPPLIDPTDPQVQAERARACQIATRGHWFWLPCPLCGVWSGGHEWLWDGGCGVASIPDIASGPGTSIGICPWCTRAGRGWEWPS